MTHSSFEHLMGFVKPDGVNPDPAGEYLGELPRAKAAMSAREFRHDDPGYRAWLATHPDGYVINIARGHNATTARVHHADCRTINGQNPHGGAWTGRYVKVCAQHLAELLQWTSDHVGKPIPRCGTCHPTRQPVRPISTTQPARGVAAPLPGGALQGPRTSGGQCGS